MDILLYGYIDTWTYDTWTYDTWIYRHMDILLHGYIDKWTYRHYGSFEVPGQLY